MENDTNYAVLSTRTTHVTADIIKIASHVEDRYKARKWSQNLRFLAFDNTIEGGYDEIVARSRINKQREAPLGSKKSFCGGCTFSSEGGPAHDHCSHTRRLWCHECRIYPLYPKDRKVRNFRIVQFDTMSLPKPQVCTHFVAVSYRWRQAKKGPYTVRTLSGKTRHNEAPAEVIDRAVSFAAHNGIRLIWIDQECIEQHDRNDQEVGIQAMDLVYQQARYSIGLLSANIPSEAHLEALVVTEQWGRSGAQWCFFPFTSLNPTINKVINHLIELLELVTSDEWSDRAWIFQESFSAGRAMTLLFPKAADVVLPPELHKFPSNRHASPQELAFDLDRLNNCMQHAKTLLAFYRKHAASFDSPDGIEGRIEHLIPKLDRFHPVAHGLIHNDGDCLVTRSRKSCSSVVAVKLLQHRQNSILLDRLAIIANLCNYEMRLDVNNLQGCQSLSTCVLTQALMNHDFSFLHPEMYDNRDSYSPKGKRPDTSAAVSDTVCEKDGHSFSWLQAMKQPFSCIRFNGLEPASRSIALCLNRISVTAHGLSCPGILWKVDGKLALHEIKNKFESTWSTMTASLRSYEYKETGKPKPTFQETLEFAALTTERYVLAAKILVAIMRLLFTKGHIDVADAIWHSIRRDRWYVDRIHDCSAPELYESVADFPDELPDQPWKMMQLDAPEDTDCLQIWLIERIMKWGFILSAQSVHCSTDCVCVEKEMDIALKSRSDELCGESPLAHQLHDLSVSGASVGSETPSRTAFSLHDARPQEPSLENAASHIMQFPISSDKHQAQSQNEPSALENAAEPSEVIGCRKQRFHNNVDEICSGCNLALGRGNGPRVLEQLAEISKLKSTLSSTEYRDRVFEAFTQESEVTTQEKARLQTESQEYPALRVCWKCTFPNEEGKKECSVCDAPISLNRSPVWCRFCHQPIPQNEPYFHCDLCIPPNLCQACIDCGVWCSPGHNQTRRSYQLDGGRIQEIDVSDSQDSKASKTDSSAVTRNFLAKQAQGAVMSSMIDYVVHHTAQKVTEKHFARDIGALITIAQYITMNQEEKEKRLQGDTDGNVSHSVLCKLGYLKAVFDVDEPCYIMTPYHASYEKLPRPVARSMSCSWVVKALSKEKSPEYSPSPFDTLQTFTTTGCVRGMWKLFDMEPMERYTLA